MITTTALTVTYLTTSSRPSKYTKSTNKHQSSAYRHFVSNLPLSTCGKTQYTSVKSHFRSFSCVVFPFLASSGGERASQKNVQRHAKMFTRSKSIPHRVEENRKSCFFHSLVLILHFHSSKPAYSITSSLSSKISSKISSTTWPSSSTCRAARSSLISGRPNSSRSSSKSATVRSR